MFGHRSWQRRLVLLSAGAALLIALAEPTRAWNDAGHMVVARIAWLRLSPEQQAQVTALLKQHPHYETYLAEKCPESVSPDEWAFLRAATWADYVRPPKTLASEDLPKHPRHKFHRGPWHYVNYPYHAGQKESGLPKQPLPNQTNILKELEKSLDVLHGKVKHDPDAVADISADANKAVRLTWVFHLVGDLHQPLHVVALVDEKLFPAGDHGDQGGNLLAIRPDSSAKPVRLHSYWDGLLGYDSRFPRVSEWAEEFTHDPQLSPELLTEFTKHHTVHDWAAESYAAAKTHAYLNGHLPHVRMSDVESHAVPEAKVPVLSAEDAAHAQQLARRRLTLAGYRLAETLKPIFGP